MKNSMDQRITALYELYKEGLIPGPEQHEVNPGLAKGARENFLYFTLPCALNFQRNSPAMWASALKTYNDPVTNYLFFPEEVVKTDADKVKADLYKHRLAVQINKHPKIWTKISETLHLYYDGDPRKVIAENGNSVKRTLLMIQKEKKQLFPFLGGPKLSNYWLFILSDFTDVNLSDPEEISIIPDTHIIKSTIELGLAKDGVSSTDVEKIWRPILKRLQILPGEMHSTLWRWSRLGFRPTV